MIKIIKIGLSCFISLIFVFNTNIYALKKVPREKTLVVTPWSDTTGPLKKC